MASNKTLDELNRNDSLTIIEDDEEDLLVSQLNMDITNQYVVFSVDREDYGLPILSVQEIISLPQLTKIPGVADYIPGIINLRGNIIPLYSLRNKFHMKEHELTEDSIVIIVQTGLEKNKTVGFIVDSVSDVLSISDEEFSETPNFNDSSEINFIEKIGHIGNRMIIIIDMKHFFNDSEHEALESVVNKEK